MCSGNHTLSSPSCFGRLRNKTPPLLDSEVFLFSAGGQSHKRPPVTYSFDIRNLDCATLNCELP